MNRRKRRRSEVWGWDKKSNWVAARRSDLLLSSREEARRTKKQLQDVFHVPFVAKVVIFSACIFSSLAADREGSYIRLWPFLFSLFFPCNKSRAITHTHRHCLYIKHTLLLILYLSLKNSCSFIQNNTHTNIETLALKNTRSLTHKDTDSFPNTHTHTHRTFVFSRGEGITSVIASATTDTMIYKRQEACQRTRPRYYNDVTQSCGCKNVQSARIPHLHTHTPATKLPSNFIYLFFFFISV